MAHGAVDHCPDPWSATLGYARRSGGRHFRQILSDAAKLKAAGPELFLEALAAAEPTVVDCADGGIRGYGMNGSPGTRSLGGG